MARSLLQQWADGIAEAIQIMREYPAGQKIAAQNFRDEILAIKTGVDTNDGTATASDILSGKVAYSKEERLVGTIPSGDASNLSVSGNRVTTAGGRYYPSSVYKDVEKKTLATPSISVNNSTGLITATETQTAGYVDSSTKTQTYQMSTVGNNTYYAASYQYLLFSPGTFITGYVYLGAANLLNLWGCSFYNGSGRTVWVLAGSYFDWIEYASGSSGTISLPGSVESLVCIMGNTPAQQGWSPVLNLSSSYTGASITQLRTQVVVNPFLNGLYVNANFYKVNPGSGPSSFTIN